MLELDKIISTIEDKELKDSYKELELKLLNDKEEDKETIRRSMFSLYNKIYKNFPFKRLNETHSMEEEIYATIRNINEMFKVKSFDVIDVDYADCLLLIYFDDKVFRAIINHKNGGNNGFVTKNKTEYEA